jgi:OmpA-OmpF porin, OOP family
LNAEEWGAPRSAEGAGAVWGLPVRTDGAGGRRWELVAAMRCNPLRWLWGLVPLIGLGGLMNLSGAFTGIEADLKRQAEAALTASGQGWATVAMAGRDATLVGQAVDNSDQLRSTGLARSVWGVRLVDDQTKLLDEEKNYVWGAQLQSDGRIRLSGFVPTPAVRQAIVGATKATFPSRDIDDRMKMARGAPAQAVWEGGISYALKQLGGLKSGGRVDLEATNLQIEGEAEDIGSYRGIKTALQNAMPQGIKLRSDKVTPPVVKPYTWGAKLANSQLQLTGYVPSERARDDVFAAAKKAFPKAAVVDRLSVAAGEPRDWFQAVTAALTRLGRLDEGSVDLRDTQLNIAGLAATDTIADDVRRGLKTDAGSAFTTVDAIRIKEVPLKVIDPFTTAATVEGGVVVLSGYVPTPVLKASLVEAAKMRFPGQRVDDRLEVAAGAPDGWGTCVQAGLAGVARLGAGRFQMSGRTLALTGQTDSEALAQSVPGEVQGVAGAACAADTRIAFTGTSAAELKRRADAATAQAAADDAARSARATAMAAAKQAADTQAAEDAARRTAALQAPVAVPTPAPTPLPAPVVATPDPDQIARTEAAKCQAALTQTRNEGVINFKRASADLDAQSNATLDRLVAVMRTCTDARIEVQGHTDAEGTPERNANLSNRRAQSVVAYFLRAGIEASRLTAAGYGETLPLAPNDTAENRALNRRIEFEVKIN